MDAQYSAINNKGQVSFYKHQTPQLYNPNTNLQGSIYMYRGHHDQTPLNFIGRQSFRPPADDSRMFDPRPMGGAHKAEEHMPILRTMPIIPKFH